MADKQTKFDHRLDWNDRGHSCAVNDKNDIKTLLIAEPYQGSRVSENGWNDTWLLHKCYTCVNIYRIFMSLIQNLFELIQSSQNTECNTKKAKPNFYDHKQRNKGSRIHQCRQCSRNYRNCNKAKKCQLSHRKAKGFHYTCIHCNAI